MKKELLAPAGNMLCLKAAINNGADAIYLAGKSYGARKFANNFTNEELKEAVWYAHLYDVKVYVTVNTIIFEEEINDVLEYIGYLNNIGVDAVIVQDIGLIKLIREYVPMMEIHASTQAHTHNLEQIKLLETLEVKRVVLARELSLEEINKLDTKMELEIFIHGALCISYSGQCLLSSGVLGRSGNRGECAGLCRIPYNLYQNGKKIINSKYLLSPKEFNSCDYVEDLKKSKAYSFKIEGRMKSPEYVGYVTSLYRKLLDNDNYKLSEEELFNLKSLYNRGFTKGYLNGELDKDWISINSSNHQGVKIGEVIGFRKNKIVLKLIHELNQGDALRFPNNEGMFVNFLYNQRDMLINKGLCHDIVLVDNKIKLKEFGDVSLTINKKLVDKINNVKEKKIGISVYVRAYKNEELEVSYSDGENKVYFKGNVVLEAKSVPLTSVRIREIMAKLGDTPFVLNNATLDVQEDIFIPVGYLNQVRRTLIDELINKRTYVNSFVNKCIYDVNNVNRSVDKMYISALARNEEQLKVLLQEKVDFIYVTNKELYDKYKAKNVYLRLDRVKEDHEDYIGENLLVGETGSLRYTKNNNVVTDYYLNVVNSAYVNYLKDLGVKRVRLSPEINSSNLKLLASHVSNDMMLEVIVYGRLEYMIMKYKMLDNRDFAVKEKYELEDKSKRKFRIIQDNFTHLMSDKNIDLINNIALFKSMGVNSVALEFSFEQDSEVKKIIEIVKSRLK